jgi:hypothetical protein
VALSTAAPAQERVNVTMADPQVTKDVSAVVRDAVARLASPACAAVLEDFSLKPPEAPLPDYVSQWVFWRDGRGMAACAFRKPRPVAVTVPGSRVVLVCNPADLNAVVAIHEVLGLGENPPSAEEITRRVEARCQQ